MDFETTLKGKQYMFNARASAKALISAEPSGHFHGRDFYRLFPDTKEDNHCKANQHLSFLEDMHLVTRQEENDRMTLTSRGHAIARAAAYLGEDAATAALPWSPGLHFDDLILNVCRNARTLHRETLAKATDDLGGAVHEVGDRPTGAAFA